MMDPDNPEQDKLFSGLLPFPPSPFIDTMVVVGSDRIEQSSCHRQSAQLPEEEDNDDDEDYENAQGTRGRDEDEIHWKPKIEIQFIFIEKNGNGPGERILYEWARARPRFQRRN